MANQVDCKRPRTDYANLGSGRTAIFVFEFLRDESVPFEKLCDGVVWRQLLGLVSVEEGGAGGTCLVVELEGQTKPLVPEFTIKGAMAEQIVAMAGSLRKLLSDPGSSR